VQDLWRDLGIAVLALGLAGLTYVLIENPIRRRRVAINWSNARVLGAGAAASLTIIAAAQGLNAHAEQSGATTPYKQLSEAKARSWTERCKHKPRTFRQLVPRSDCVRVAGDTEKYLVVWGDSHANHWAEMLEFADVANRFIVLPRWMGECPALLGVQMPADKHPAPCARFTSAILEEIKHLQQEERLMGVIVSSRWVKHLGWSEHSGIPKSIDEAQADRSVERGLRSMLQTLSERAINVVVIAPIPEQRFDVPSCLARRTSEVCSVTRATAEARRSIAAQAVQRAAADLKTVHVWDPLPALCDEKRCLAKRDGIVIYRDSHHLTDAGSRRLAPILKQSAAWRAMIRDDLVTSSRNAANDEPKSMVVPVSPARR